MLTFSNVPRTSIFTWNGARVREINFGQYGTERAGFRSKDTNEIFMKRKFHPHTQPNKARNECRGKKSGSESQWNRKDKVTLEEM